MDMFDVQTENTSQTPPTEQVNMFEQLVGEGKKFKDQESLARAKAESDNFIEKLLAEKRSLEAQLVEKHTADDIIGKLDDYFKSTSQSSNQPSGQDEKTQQNALTQDDILKLFEEREKKTQAEKNQKFVIDQLQGVWGSQYKLKLEEKAAELGLSKEQVNKMAMDTPKALLSALNAKGEANQPSVNLPKGSVNTQALGGPQGQGNDYNYYRNILKTDKQLYYSKDVQAQMVKDAQTNPDFYKT